LLVLIVSVTLAATVYFLLTRIDLIVHVQLYNFGLMFSHEWVDPYRLIMWLIYACLLVPVVLNGFAFVSGLIKLKPKISDNQSKVESRLSLKSALSNSKYKLLVLIVNITLAATVYFLLTRIDGIVHGQLYNFGLIFSAEWADSYRAYMWAIYACMVTPVVLSGAGLVFGLIKIKQNVSEAPHVIESPRKVAAKPANLPVKPVEASKRGQGSSEKASASAHDFEERVRNASKPEPLSEKDRSVPVKNLEVEVEHEEEPEVAAGSMNSENQVDDLRISCAKCKKTFHRPLVMLDFSGGKARLVNVCPFCNQIVGGIEPEMSIITDVNVAEKVVKHGDT
jgi:uncharacterized Zn-finger protein